MLSPSKSKFLGGVLLIAGTTIGGGILGMPTVTGLAGFWPTCLLFAAYWIFMTYTAFLILEVNLWMPGEAPNLITMAKLTLGRGGEVVNWVFYLLLLYLLTSAYIAGMGDLLSHFILNWTGWMIPPTACFLGVILLLALFVYEGVAFVDYANRLMMVGLGVCYFVMVAMLAPQVNPELLQHFDWEALSLSVSMVATSFGFHIIIPTLVRYLDHDVPLLKKTLLVGSVIPIVVYILWEWLTLGTIPLHVIQEGFYQGFDGGKLLATVAESPSFAQVILLFAFFAILTSFLGVSQSLRDFLADGLHIKNTFKGRILLDVLTFIPPVIFIFWNERAFLKALSYAGAFGVVTLLALMPALMAWSGRYRKGFKGPFRVPGGRLALLLVIFLSCTVIFLEGCGKLGCRF